MKNFVQNGEALDTILTAETKSGEVVVMSDVCGVAVKDGAVGETIAVSMVGVYELPKAAGASLAQGKKVYWDASAKTVVATATGNNQLGYVAQPAASAATLVAVSLIPA